MRVLLQFAMLVFWIAALLQFALVTCHYPEYALEDVCESGNVTLISEMADAGVIRGTDKSCALLIKPPKGKGVVVSLRKIDLQELRFTCLDYLRIYHSDVFTSPSTICHFKFDLNEKVSFYSKGPMNLIYHVSKNNYGKIRYERGFTVIYTIVSEDFNDCSDAFLCENGRCISKSLTCDSHNNCGDRSDEDHMMCESRQLAWFKMNDVLYGIVFSLLILSIVATFCILYRRRSRVLLLEAHPCPPAAFTNPCYPTGIPDTFQFKS